MISNHRGVNFAMCCTSKLTDSRTNESDRVLPRARRLPTGEVLGDGPAAPREVRPSGEGGALLRKEGHGDGVPAGGHQDAVPGERKTEWRNGYRSLRFISSVM